MDTGSTPVYSIKTEPVELCIGSYRIQKSVLFGVLKKIKVTALYVAKAIYNAVTFMNAELHLILFFNIAKYQIDRLCLQEFVIRDNFFRFPNLKQFVE